MKTKPIDPCSEHYECYVWTNDERGWVILDDPDRREYAAKCFATLDDAKAHVNAMPHPNLTVRVTRVEARTSAWLPAMVIIAECSRVNGQPGVWVDIQHLNA